MIGVIEGNGSENLDPERWVSLISAHPALANVPSREGKNPFTGEPTVFHAPATSAHVKDAAGEHLGSLEWAEGDSNAGLLVSSKAADEVGSAKLMEVVNEIAQQLGGTFKTMDELEGA